MVEPTKANLMQSSHWGAACVKKASDRWQWEIASLDSEDWKKYSRLVIMVMLGRCNYECSLLSANNHSHRLMHIRPLWHLAATESEPIGCSATVCVCVQRLATDLSPPLFRDSSTALALSHAYNIHDVPELTAVAVVAQWHSPVYYETPKIAFLHIKVYPWQLM